MFENLVGWSNCYLCGCFGQDDLKTNDGLCLLCLRDFYHSLKSLKTRGIREEIIDNCFGKRKNKNDIKRIAPLK